MAVDTADLTAFSVESDARSKWSLLAVEHILNSF